MINQIPSDLLDFAFAGTALFIFIGFVVLLIIISLYIWKFAIEKSGGIVEGLGQVFVTLLISGILNMIIVFASTFLAGIIFQSFDAMIYGYLIAIVVGFFVQLKIFSSRHNMSMGEAFLAVIIVIIIEVIIIVVLFIVLLGIVIALV